MRLFTDLAILILGAGLPAAAAIYLLRKQLFAPPGQGQAWSAVMFGTIALSGLAMLAIWLAYAQAEQAVSECRALPVGQQMDCEDGWLITVIIGMPAALSVAAFLLTAIGIRVWRGSRKNA